MAKRYLMAAVMVALFAVFAVSSASAVYMPSPTINVAGSGDGYRALPDPNDAESPDIVTIEDEAPPLAEGPTTTEDADAAEAPDGTEPPDAAEGTGTGETEALPDLPVYNEDEETWSEYLDNVEAMFGRAYMLSKGLIDENGQPLSAPPAGFQSESGGRDLPRYDATEQSWEDYLDTVEEMFGRDYMQSIGLIDENGQPVSAPPAGFQSGSNGGNPDGGSDNAAAGNNAVGAIGGTGTGGNPPAGGTGGGATGGNGATGGTGGIGGSTGTGGSSAYISGDGDGIGEAGITSYGEGPAENGTYVKVEDPNNPGEYIYIPEEEVPLIEAPSINEEVSILDELVPLDESPEIISQRGTLHGLNVAATATAAIGSGLFILLVFGRRKKEEEENKTT